MPEGSFLLSFMYVLYTAYTSGIWHRKELELLLLPRLSILRLYFVRDNESKPVRGGRNVVCKVDKGFYYCWGGVYVENGNDVNGE